MSAENFLARLQKVRKTGPGRWIASCPAHEDSSPSLNVKEEPSGQVLFICRAGCHQDSIRQAVGMEWGDFFPEGVYSVPLKRAFPAADVLCALESEALFVAVCASNLANGVELSDKDRERLMIAYQRIYAAKEMTVGR